MRHVLPVFLVAIIFVGCDSQTAIETTESDTNHTTTFLGSEIPQAVLDQVANARAKQRAMSKSGDVVLYTADELEYSCAWNNVLSEFLDLIIFDSQYLGVCGVSPRSLIPLDDSNLEFAKNLFVLPEKASKVVANVLTSTTATFVSTDLVAYNKNGGEIDRTSTAPGFSTISVEGMNIYSFAIEGAQAKARWYDFQVFYGNAGLDQTPELPILGAVTGSGHITWPEGTPGEGIWRTFTLSARKFSDGSVMGHMQLNNHGSTNWKGLVECLIVQDNQAYVAGTMIKMNSEHLDDFVPFFGHLIDGSSSGAVDQISWIYIDTTGKLYTDTCSGIPIDGAPFNELESGNITVRDNS